MTKRDGGLASATPQINKQIFLIFVLTVAARCFAQAPLSADRSDANSQATSQARAQDPASDEAVVVPAGTHLPLVLTHPVDSKSTHDIHAQTTAPVIVDGKVVIPAGTFLQGKAAKLTRRGSRAEMILQPVSLVFANGYVATIRGETTLETDEETAWLNPSSATKAGAILAPVVGLGVGAGIGAALHTTDSTTFGGQTITTRSLKGVGIGSLVGLTAGGVVSLVLVARSHHFYVAEGSPLEASLPQDITFSQAQVSAAVQDAAAQPPPMPVRASRAPPSPQSGTSPSGPASCSAGQEWCRGQCVDSSAFISDDNNCGRCGNSCSISESCTGGSCSCAAGYESCMGRCVSGLSFISDSSNCGRCGNFCSAGESCFAGTCRKPGT